MPRIIVTEEQWIHLGAERFAQGGIEALVIEKMASKLKCSKSSFYWYFSNRSEFVRKIVDYWNTILTQQVMTASSKVMTAEEKLSVLMHHMFSTTQKGDFLFYLRKLSLEEADYQEVIERLETFRMNFAKELFVQTGMPEDLAEHKSWLLYHYFIGWYERHKSQQLAEEDVHHHVTRLHKSLL
ncbi:TetR/AcrR family transcriptional regulator [Paenibacillus lupini]|uniref:TetR/AcrR family transcriptional regulator n=1 Tax=Paenibacillus lupini TaxID=1450204 RepID=UPI001424795A|nr:TetR/AcrR family transcriptional regulator [Paenibacillus lupini]NIK22802.1 AcrR family transcriptional regulator [Paenibacillus lupini]